MIVDAALYRGGERVPVEGSVDDLRAIRRQLHGDGDFMWVGLHEPGQAELDQLAEVFGLHELAIEDAVKAHQRPKLELYDDTLFMILKTLWYVDERDAVETGEISIFQGHDFVVTVRHGEGAGLREARAQLEDQHALLAHGPSAVLHAVCDAVVDGYERVAAELEIDVDEVELSVFSQELTRDSARIYVLKRELAEVRRAVQPLREPMRRFLSGQVELVPEETQVYFRDVADHLTRVSETTETLDGLLSTAFEAHLAQISVRQNEDLRKISAAAALIVVPTLIAGIYGMNFDHMPELGWSLGYAWALLLMVGASGGLLWIFKRSGWL
ncbi:magnesium/cobalt transporter CorA [Nocardioides coralli]|uniref:magnesium/cobalt transporter CorA n=1 Tax=Nocardioides coralli TaxID=2872154 RepID=UPI001CA3B3C0|nr:magnesium/cobalt transporter CorA [Nocardioides coralli]QZY27653.1 magnesium/cobalt transporter CorA [Nocardioides coralli]